MKLAHVFRRPKPRRPKLEDRYREIIGRLAPGRTFIDVGCIGAHHATYTFHAAASGAAEVAGFDMNEATPEFHEANTRLGNRVKFVQGDINTVNVGELGTFDVVFCTSVLNHAPNPMLTLLQLRRLTRQHLVLGCPTVPERDLPHTAVFLPCLDEAGREAVTNLLGIKGRKPGLDSEFIGWRSYANWIWCFTPSCVRAMLKAANCEIVEAYEYPRYGCYVARPTTGGLPLEGPGDPRRIVPPNVNLQPKTVRSLS